MRRFYSALFTLWTVLALLGAHASPAFAFAQVAGREGIEQTSASPTGDREAVSVGRPRSTPDARKLERSPRASHHAPLAGTWSTATSAAPRVATVSQTGVVPLLSWSGWETSSRARARLMTFLN